MLNMVSERGKYNPDSDILQFFKLVGLNATNYLNDFTWDPALAAFARSTGLTPETMVPAALALAKYQYECTSGHSDDPVEIWFRCGLGALPLPQQMAVVYCLGRAAMTGFMVQARTRIERGTVPFGTDAAREVVEQKLWEVDPTVRG